MSTVLAIEMSKHKRKTDGTEKKIPIPNLYPAVIRVERKLRLWILGLTVNCSLPILVNQ